MARRGAPVDLDQFQPFRREGWAQRGNLQIVLERIAPARPIARQGIGAGEKPDAGQPLSARLARKVRRRILAKNRKAKRKNAKMAAYFHEKLCISCDAES